MFRLPLQATLQFHTSGGAAPAVRRALGPGRWELVLVTDDDAGGSTAVVAEVATGLQELATDYGS